MLPSTEARYCDVRIDNSIFVLNDEKVYIFISSTLIQLICLVQTLAH